MPNGNTFFSMETHGPQPGHLMFYHAGAEPRPLFGLHALPSPILIKLICHKTGLITPTTTTTTTKASPTVAPTMGPTPTEKATADNVPAPTTALASTNGFGMSSKIIIGLNMVVLAMAAFGE